MTTTAPVKLIDRLGLTPADREWFVRELNRRAAAEFELAGRFSDAAECLEDAGDSDQAVQLLLRHNDRNQAARMLFDRERYREALECYGQWLEQIDKNDIEATVRARLGIAACMHRLDEAPERMREQYRQALAMAERAGKLTGLTHARCWQAVGEYGARTGRWDLVQVGYERALLALDSPRSRETEAVLREYLAAVKNNRLLEQRLRERLAEFVQKVRREKPRGAALKEAAKRIVEVREFVGHGDVVCAACFSPDGRLLASGSWDKTIRLWNPETGLELQRLEGHSSTVYSVSFSPNGRLLASGSSDNTIRLWNPETGQELRRLEGHSGSIQSVSFSPDGRLLASGSNDNTIRLWNPETGLELRRLEGHSNTVLSVSFSPDRRLLASGSSDSTIRLWNPETGRELQRLEGHKKIVNSVNFSPGGRLLASGSDDTTIRLWNPETGLELRRLEGHTSWVWRAIFSPDSRLLASGSGDQTNRLWTVETGEQISTINRETISVRETRFSPDGRYLLVIGNKTDHTLRLFDVSALCLEPDEPSTIQQESQ